MYCLFSVQVVVIWVFGLGSVGIAGFGCGLGCCGCWFGVLWVSFVVGWGYRYLFEVCLAFWLFVGLWCGLTWVRLWVACV